MAAAIFLVRKTVQGGDNIVNNVVAVLINDDDTNTLSQHVTAAVGACNAAYPQDPAGSPAYQDGYFDTADLIGPPTAGLLPVDQDAVVFGKDETREVIA